MDCARRLKSVSYTVDAVSLFPEVVLNKVLFIFANYHFYLILMELL